MTLPPVTRRPVPDAAGRAGALALALALALACGCGGRQRPAPEPEPEHIPDNPAVLAQFIIDSLGEMTIAA